MFFQSRVLNNFLEFGYVINLKVHFVDKFGEKNAKIEITLFFFILQAHKVSLMICVCVYAYGICSNNCLGNHEFVQK